MWMDFLYEYGLFLVKFGTVIGGVAVIAFFVTMLRMRSRVEQDGHLEVKHINQKFDHAKLMLEAATLPKGSFKKIRESNIRRNRKRPKNQMARIESVFFVINFKGDVRADEVASLREEISAILTTAGNGDEVLVILESVAAARCMVTDLPHHNW